jgi:membrane-bound lytic murein transglycosylase MltF
MCLFALWLLFLISMVLVEIHNAQGAETVPPEAERYKRDLIRNARFTWGLTAPIAVFAGQLHQESRWRVNAKSKYASGLAQFTPDTAIWIGGAYSAELGEANPLNPVWALRALVIYDKHIWDKVGGRTPCDAMAFTLAGYNAGLGWVRREKRAAIKQGINSQIYFDGVDRVCLRKAEFCRETLQYATRILILLQPLYVTWGNTISCALIK